MDKLFTNSTLQFAVRFHFQGKLTLQELEKSFEQSPFVFYVMAIETDANRPHVQGYLAVEPNGGHEPDDIRNWLKKVFQIDYSIRKDTGNKVSAISIVKVRDMESYKKYILKEGNFISKGVDVEELKKLQTITFPKKKKFQQELDLLEIEFLNSNMEHSHYLFEFMKLKGEHRQIINVNYAKQRLLMLIAKRDQKVLKRIADNIAEELKYLSR